MDDEMNNGTPAESSLATAVSELVPSAPEPAAPAPSEPAIAAPVEETSSSTAESSAQEPMEVISVSDLVDILTQAGGENTEETPVEEPAEETPASAEDAGGIENFPVYTPSSGDTVTVEGMQEVLQHLETLEVTAAHPMMETPFEDYTVTEGLLLLVFVLLLLNFFLNLIRRWF